MKSHVGHPVAAPRPGSDADSPAPDGRSRRRRPSLSNVVKDLILNELILNGAIAPGERLPTEAELCERYDVSRITVRAALRSLRDAGYIDVRQGLGSTVLPRANTLATGLDQLSSLEVLAAADGDQLASEDVEIEEVELAADDAAKLSLPAGNRALVVRRVKILHNTRVAYIVDYIPEGVLDFDLVRREFSGSVLDVLLSHPELQVEYADATLTAIGAGQRLAGLLQVPVGTPVLNLEEITLTRSGRAVNLSKCWMLPNYFSFTLRRRRGHS
ncbi:MAG TPA: GntR family transcriptional regulator [Micromonosporaceae bacterium]|nr:GntR family transcriptional regulator [Micromonosporaceae bacterium]